MNAIEQLTLRIREVKADTEAPLHITAPLPLIERLIDEFRTRGQTEDYDDDSVWLGPYISVYRDDDLPPDTFKIELHTQWDCHG